VGVKCDLLRHMQLELHGSAPIEGYGHLPCGAAASAAASLAVSADV